MTKSLKPLSKLLKTGSVCSRKQHSMRRLTSLRRLLSIGSLSFLLTLSSPFIGYFPPYSPSLQVLAQSNDTRKAEADRFLQQGIEMFQTSKFEAALESWQKALDIYRKIKHRKGESNVLLGIGIAHGSLGNYSKAIDSFQQTLTIARETQDLIRQGKSLGNLGIISRKIGDYNSSVNYHLQSLKIFQEIKDRREEGIALGNLGLAYNNLKDYSKAIEYLQEKLKIAKEINDYKGKSIALGNIALVYENLGEYPEAIEYSQQSLKIDQEMEDRNGESNGLGNIGNAYYKMGDYSKAINYHLRHLKIARNIKNREGEGNALNNLGVAYYKQGNFKLAESNLYKSIEVKESLRVELKDNNKITIFDIQRSTYNILQQVLIAQNKTDAALEVAERGRARAFVELLASKLSPNPNEKLFTPPNIDQIKQIASTQNATLVQYSITYNDFKFKGKRQVKESKLYIWVVRPTGKIAVKQVDLTSINKSLEELVISSRDSIGVRGSNMFDVSVVTPSPEDPTQKLKQLHKLLIAPIADLLPKDRNERVIFIPQESLFTVPFPALLDEKGKYLVEKHTILTAPSIQVLDFTRQHKLRNRKLGIGSRNALVVGNPTMPKIELGDLKMNLSALPGSEKEANTVAQLLDTQALIGNKASKAKVIEKMQNAGTIHLATHGLLQDFKGFGVPGAIVLAADSIPKQNDGINGLLTASEILDLKLRADLVVLSACDTGRGKITGDGVIGLSRSLISVGVPSVIVSLWKVNDNSTEFLMSEFYRNLQKNPDKAVALRQAMLTTMKQQAYSNPLRWAAFTLIGEAK